MTQAVRSALNWPLLGALALCAAMYWQGVGGPFLFDDSWNLAPVEQWHAGLYSWRQALLPNAASLVDSRPVTMASFMASIWTGGLGPAPLKAGNILLHLATGVLVHQVLLQLARGSADLAPHAGKLALIGSAIWLLHPLHVSTVLYVVQRATQLAAFFSLAAILVFLGARQRLLQGMEQPRAILARLFVAFPVLVVLAVLSKQNAAITPLLCLVLHAGLPHRRNGASRGTLAAFGTTFVLVPLLGAAALLAIRPGSLTAGYVDWDFNLLERLMTQPRALAGYAQAWFAPYSPGMGLYTDDFAISRGLLDPPATLVTIVLGAAISFFTLTLRTRAPLLASGWFFFLGAHLVEGSILPLEMYYEHRNYLPSFGLVVACLGGVQLALGSTAMARSARPRVWPLVAVGICVVLGFATLGRILVWQHPESIVEQGYQQHPHSIHAVFDMASQRSAVGDFEGARASLSAFLGSDRPRERAVSNLFLAVIGCVEGSGLDTPALGNATAAASTRITVYEAQMFKLLDNAIQQPGCAGTAEGPVATVLVHMLDAATLQPETSRNKFVMRELAARILVRAGMMKEATRQSSIAWRYGGNPPAGALLARLYMGQNRFADAAPVVARLRQQIDPGDVAGRRELALLEQMLASGVSQQAR